MRLSAFALVCLVLPGVGGIGHAQMNRQKEALSLPARTLSANGTPYHLLVHQNVLYVGCFHGANLSTYDAKTLKPIDKIHLDAYEVKVPVKQNGQVVGQKRKAYPCPPGDMIVADGRLWVGQIFSEHLLAFDLETMRVVKRLPLGGQGDLAVSSDGKTVYYASNEKNEFHII